MAKGTIFLVSFLLLHCWVAMAEAEYLKYKDPKQPLNTRIKDLIGRMTLEEKIGQMVQIDRSVASADVMNKYFIGKFFLKLSFNLKTGVLMRISTATSTFLYLRACNVISIEPNHKPNYENTSCVEMNHVCSVCELPRHRWLFPWQFDSWIFQH
jgi:hypothetical protein